MVSFKDTQNNLEFFSILLMRGPFKGSKPRGATTVKLEIYCLLLLGFLMQHVLSYTCRTSPFTNLLTIVQICLGMFQQLQSVQK